jgi:protein-S-isoprenylcysteine O-methyltransferase Ste14
MTDPPDPADVRTARLLVAIQMVLLVALVLVPGRGAPPGAPLLVVAAVAAVVGGAVVLLGAGALGRGLTAAPLPNAHARLRTGGLYRYVRHPIYSGVLLCAAAYTAAAGGWAKVAVLALLVVHLNVKARWEERHLARRFPEYAGYAARTPRFVPRVRPR